VSTYVESVLTEDVAEEARREVIAAVSEGRCWVCGASLVPCRFCLPSSGCDWLLCETILDATIVMTEEHGRCYRMRVSIDCPDCSFHETRDFYGELEPEGWS
jgi:hypothetical protein